MRSRIVATAALLVAATACATPSTGGGALQYGEPPTTRRTSPTTPVPPPIGGVTGAVVSPTGVVVPVTSGPPVGPWTVMTPCGNSAPLAQGTFLPGATVVLDAGHGGSDPGAQSPAGLKESAINLAVAVQAKAALESAGVSVLMTRTADYDVNLTPRAEIAKDAGALAFVSIHHNADPDGPWPRPGTETYYQIGSADSKRLAGLVYEEVERALSAYTVSWVADTDAGAKYRPGSNGDYYAVLRLPGKTVSALAELAFISNPSEATLLARPDVQRVEGAAVARGIVRYLTTKDPGSGFTEPYPRPSPPPVPGGAPPPPCSDPPLT